MDEEFDVKSPEEIDAWIERNGRPAFDRVSRPGGMSSRGREMMAAWTQQGARDAAAKRAEESAELQRRSTVAAETSAAAAVESAAHARDAVRWSRWAAIIAVAALAVAAWPFAKVLIE